MPRQKRYTLTLTGPEILAAVDAIQNDWGEDYQDHLVEEYGVDSTQVHLFKSVETKLKHLVNKFKQDNAEALTARVMEIRSWAESQEDK